MKRFLPIIVIIVVLAGAGYLLTRPKTANAPTAATPAITTDTTNVAATISYTGGGFTPATVTIKSGQSVTVTNNSSSTMQLDSNPHPVHTDDPELNIGQIAPGQSRTFVLSKAGTWGYHNHLNPGDQGTVVVQ